MSTRSVALKRKVKEIDNSDIFDYIELAPYTVFTTYSHNPDLFIILPSNDVSHCSECVFNEHHTCDNIVCTSGDRSDGISVTVKHVIL